ncbi:MAG: hypothetical protein NC548_47775, partial [Lachnospiraceae bacterium]|nr:hypothetical protein [Lachnospiraceae bacterium]
LYCNDCLKYKDKIKYYQNKKYNEHQHFKELYFRYWFITHIRSNVDKEVAVTIWIHNGEAEVLFADAAQEKFREYQSLYSSPEYDFMFNSELYDYNKTCIFNKEFIEDCFEFIQKPRATCDQYIKEEILSPFNEDAIIVTKAWTTEQYNKYIKPLN